VQAPSWGEAPEARDPRHTATSHCVLGPGLVPLARFACERRRDDARGEDAGGLGQSTPHPYP